MLITNLSLTGSQKRIIAIRLVLRILLVAALQETKAIMKSQIVSPFKPISEKGVVENNLKCVELSLCFLLCASSYYVSYYVLRDPQFFFSHWGYLLGIGS